MRRAAALLLLALSLPATLAGCGGGGGGSTEKTDAGQSAPRGQGGSPLIGRVYDQPAPPPAVGIPVAATKNTTRVAGADAASDAAAVAQAVFPDTRPRAVALADAGDWRAATLAAALMASPLRAPLLYGDAGSLPTVTLDALDRLRPTGSRAAHGAQAIGVGTVPAPPGLRLVRIGRGAGPFALAAAVDRFLTAARGRPSSSVVVVAADKPTYGVPAAGWAAKSGDPVLFVSHDAIPAATRAALLSHGRPRIYVLGPATAVGTGVVAGLRRYGPVTRVSGPDPVRSAIEFARFSDGAFGWGVTDPGHGLVFAAADRPLDAPAAAALSASGMYGPLLLVDSARRLPAPVAGYLLDIQPGYRRDPVRGVYNHGWIIGDESVISAAVQARIDTLLEIAPVRASGG